MTLFELVGKIVVKNQDAKSALKETSEAASDTAEDVKDSGGKISDSFKKIGTAVATYLTVDAIKNFGLACINAVSDAQAMNSQFTQVFGDLEGSASKNLSKIADDAGIMENRMKGSYTKIAAFAKTTGADTETALGIADRAMIAVADSAAFYDRSLEDTTESLQSFLKGNFENDAALGLSCTETTRNAAANALYGKSFKDLSESQKQLTLLQMVEDANKLSGALGQASRESNTWTNQTGNLKQAWTDFQAVLGEPILEYAVSVVGWLADKVGVINEKFSSGTNPVQWFVDKIKSFKEIAEEVYQYASEKFEPILDDLKTAFTAVKDAVQPLIDKFSEYFSSGEAADDMTNNLKETIDFLADAYEKVSGFIDKVVQGFKDAVEWGKEHETGISLIAVAVGTLTAAIIAYNVAQAIKNAGGIIELAQLAALAIGVGALTVAETAHTVATTIATAATTAFGAVLSFLTSPITLVVVAIGALIAIGVALYKNWDTIKAKCSELGAKIKEKFSEMKEAVVGKVNELKEKAVEKFNSLKTAAVEKFNSLKTAATEKVNSLKSAALEKFNALKDGVTEKINSVKSKVTSVFSNIKDSISEKIEGAKNTVKNAIDKIKGFFDFKWSLPKLKLPHFSISGKFSLDPPSIPKFSVSWYKKAMNTAMVLNDPTIFGYSNASGKYLGAGDGNGNEVVTGESHLMKMIGSAVENKVSGMTQILYSVLLDILNAIVSGNGEMLQALLDGHTLKIGEREFGRLVREYA